MDQPQTETITETRKKLGEQEEEALKKKPKLRNWGKNLRSTPSYMQRTSQLRYRPATGRNQTNKKKAHLKPR